jgi:hypothetical protein
MSSPPEDPEGEIGADAQLAQIKEFATANGYKVVRSFPEERSGLRYRELGQAVKEAKDRNCPIIVSDFGRILSVLRGKKAGRLLNKKFGVTFISAAAGEEADATDADAGANAAALRKARMDAKSHSAKASLKISKANGVKLGNTKNLSVAQRKGAASNAKAAAFRAREFEKLVAAAERLGARSPRATVAKLNAMGHKTAQGRVWTVENFYRRRGMNAARKAKVVTSAPIIPTKPSIYDYAGRLTADGLRRFKASMAKKRYKPLTTGKLMLDMGFNRYDVSIRDGLRQLTSMKLGFRGPLQKWIEDTEAGGAGS